MKKELDRELVDLYVGEYVDEIEGCLPDLFACCDEYDERGIEHNRRDAIIDFASGRIYDGERGKVDHDALSAAVRKIADLYV